MRSRNRIFVRAEAVLRVQQRLEEESYPRLQMTLIVALTSAFGLLSSFLLLRLGIDAMALRYPLALALAYVVFLLLIWLWLRTNAEDYKEDYSEGYVDVPDFPDALPSGASGTSGVPLRPIGDVNFGGGGATSGSFDVRTSPKAKPADAVSDAGGSSGSDADANEIVILLIVIALAIGLAFASFYLIYIAPTLLAEVLVDGTLSYALYRQIRGEDPAHWLITSVRRTFLPFLVIAIFLAIVGATLSAYAPGARSIGEVIHRTFATKPHNDG
jgi:uncharacterized membrane protein